MPVIAALLGRAFGEYRGLLHPEPGALRETAESLRDALTRGVFWVGEEDREVVACLFVEKRPQGAYIGRLAVDPHHRRCGWAQRLIAAAEEAARRDGAEKLELGVRIALAHNIALFEKLGFRITGARAHPGFAVPTWYVMEKRLVDRR